MTAHRKSNNRDRQDDDGDIARLLTLAGPRPVPPADMERRVHAAVMETFDELPQSGSRTAVIGLALAASLTLAVGVAWLLRDTDPVLPAGNILASIGEYSVRDPEGSYTAAGSSGPITEVTDGSMIQTSGNSRLFISLTEGTSVRLDEDTSVTLHQNASVWLHYGRLYVDVQHGDSVVVVAADATVTDIGTRFTVSLDEDDTTVGVRDGAVKIAVSNTSFTSRADEGVGEMLIISGSTMQSRSPISTLDDRWAWIESVRPPYSGSSVRDYLDWVARETGRTLSFVTPVVAQQSANSRIPVVRSDTTDMDIVRQTLRTTNYRIAEGRPHEMLVDFSVQ